MNYYFVVDKENTERYENVQEQWDKIKDFCNGKAFFVDAIMAKRYPEEWVQSHAVQPTFLSSGEIGCALSHLKVYQEFLKSDAKYAVVFEDDVTFVEDFASKETQEYVESFMDKQEKPTMLVLQRGVYVKDIVYHTDKFNVYDVWDLVGMYGYVLNRQAAQNILTMQEKIYFEIDALRFYKWLKQCEFFALDRDLVGLNMKLQLNSSIEAMDEGRIYTSQRRKLKHQNFLKLCDKYPLSTRIYARLKNLERVYRKIIWSINKRINQ